MPNCVLDRAVRTPDMVHRRKKRAPFLGAPPWAMASVPTKATNTPTYTKSLR